MFLPIVVYGATHCDDTERTCNYLRECGIPFQEVNIDHVPDAAQFVRFINNGYCSTPTLVLGEGKRKIILTEPSNEELKHLISRVQLFD